MDAISAIREAARKNFPDAMKTASLDPETDFETISYRLYAFEFSWDIEKALEFALFRTYGVPSISRLLVNTGEFENRPRKRYDDTALILAEIMENGLGSVRGRRSISRMNAMHGRYRISNEDMLYVLSTFVCEPIRWLERFGRRPMTEKEKRAWFLYYRSLGHRMGIRQIPDKLATLMEWNVAYESARFQFAESNRKIAMVTTDLLLGFYLPRCLCWVGRPVVRSLMDPPLLRSMGYEPAPVWMRYLVPGALRIRAGVLRWFPRRTGPRLLTQSRRPTYPEGYRIEELGTSHAVSYLPSLPVGAYLAREGRSPAKGPPSFVVAGATRLPSE
ncbi:MAG: oxygenase MpaB family protein, partial [Pseudomonadota bacterium]